MVTRAGAELEGLGWGSAARCVTGGVVVPVLRAQLWEGEGPLCAGTEGASSFQEDL